MQILKDIVANVPEYPIKQVIAGIQNILVESIHCGLSTTLLEEGHPFSSIKASGNLTNMTTKTLAELSFSEIQLEAALGIAAINSASDISSLKLTMMNAKELLVRKGKDKKVALIGHFPFIDKISYAFAEIFVFELFPQVGDYSVEKIPEILPQADVLAISATSLCNHTFDKIMQHRSKNCFTVMLGPTTPLSPILFDYGIDALSGVLVKNNELVKIQVMEGVLYRNLKGIELITILKDSNKNDSIMRGNE
ncbi:MAG: DUF364 domain-containing protein [Candidatus Cloacimonetes bacterium]|nr:DUF364 domain-containing protein [Candidatus Cloacimonadota bacterium]